MFIEVEVVKYMNYKENYNQKYNTKNNVMMIEY